jgi:NAD(P)-dependent dehydrogenase (short-subunit alcohol dehydrogenase family)
VALVDRRFSPEAVLRLEQINRQPAQAAHFVADVTDPLQIRKAVDQAQAAFGPIDILINNAGPFSMDPYLSMRVEVWDEIMNANLRAVYLFSQLVAPGMNERGWGRIINIAQVSAFLRNHSVYSLAKSSIIFLTEQLALELKPGVTINAIASGQIAESAPDISAFDPTFVERAIAITPAGRLVSRSDIAHLMVRLCSTEFDMQPVTPFHGRRGAPAPLLRGDLTMNPLERIQRTIARQEVDSPKILSVHTWPI